MKRAIWIILLLLFANSCTRSPQVQDDPPLLSKIPEINLIHIKDEAIVSEGIQQTFSKYLSHTLYCHEGFQKGPDITAEYRFIRFSPGSRLLGTLGGGLKEAAEGSICIEASFKDANNQVMGQIQSKARFGNSLLGNTVDEALKKTAEEIASYANSIFIPIVTQKLDNRGEIFSIRRSVEIEANSSELARSNTKPEGIRSPRLSNF